MRADVTHVVWRKSSYSDGQTDCLEVGALWRKSTYSTGQEACLEVGDLWRKSTYSAGQEECVEVADNIPTGPTPAVVPVRDSKNPAGPALLIPVGAWSAFVGALKAGGAR